MENDKLISQLAEKAKPVKPALSPFALLTAWLAISVLYILIALNWLTIRPDLTSQLQEPLFLAEIIALTLIILSTSLAAVLLSYPDMYQKEYLTHIPFAAFALFVFILILEWSFSTVSSNPPHGLRCTTSITLAALLPAIILFYYLSTLASTHAQRAGSIAMLAAFSIGALTMRLHENVDAIGHFVLWHYLPMLAIGVLGILLGRIFLKW